MRTPRHILSLTSEEKRKFLDSFDHIFSDIDGVVWNVTQKIHGSADGFNELRKAGKHIAFITNNSVRSEEQCLKLLRLNNIEIEPDNLIHPAKSIVQYLKSIQFEGTIYVVAADEYVKVLRQAGFKVLDGPNIIVRESFAELVSHIENQEPVKAVVIDFDFNLSFLKMMKAHFYLRDPDCLLIEGATDYHLPLSKELSVLGPGPFGKVLEETSGRKLLTFGKPGETLANFLIQQYRIKSPQRALMIGDMLEQDVRFATYCGFQSLLVLSGGCSYEDLMAQTDPNIIPDFYAQDMSEFVDFMKDIRKSSV